MVGPSHRVALTGAARARRQDAVDLTTQLVRFRSENPKLLEDPAGQAAGLAQEAACQAFLSNQFDDLGMVIDSWEVLPGRRDVVGRLVGTGGGPSLILNGHVDVVPASTPNAWPYDPWAGEVVDGRLWGRGSCDTKSGIAAGLIALRILRDAGIRLKGDVLFETVVDEETGGPGTRSALERGYRADAALVLEPTSGAIVSAEGGLIWLNVVIEGRGGHSAARYRSIHAGGAGTAVNAIDKGVKLLSAIGDLEREWGNRKVHPLMPLGITTINPGMIAGGTGVGSNGLPASFRSYSNMADRCVIGLSLKYLPDEDGEAVRREFEEFVARFAMTDPWLREHPPVIEWEVSGLHFPPCDIARDHPLCIAAADATTAVTGSTIWSGSEGVTDLAFLSDAGIPGIVYGPGSVERSHGTNEYLDVEQLYVAMEVIARTIATYCGVA